MSAETPANSKAPGSGSPSLLQRFWLPTALVVAGIVVVTAMGFEAVAVVQLFLDPQHVDPGVLSSAVG